jgi:GNAT superfamily N-acetyltransferase
MAIEVRALEPKDHAWVASFLVTQAGSTRVVSRGRLHHADQLPGFLALEDGTPGALLTYRVADRELEVVTLHATPAGRGLGSCLLERARQTAQDLGCRRLWLITTNDNEPAIQFYRRRGMSLVAVHRHAIRESRKLKPEIPLTGVDGTPIEDEIEFEFRL